MSCDTVRKYQTAEERQREIEAALTTLQQQLGNGTVTIKLSDQGALCFAGWEQNRNGITDACAYRKLTLKGSFELRQAVQRAEMMQGRKVNPQTITAGVHSHDGGTTWVRD